MEARTETASGVGGALGRLPGWALAAGALALIAAALVALALAGGDALPERTGPPVEELAVERTVLEPNRIELSLRNTGPDPVEISQAFVNDAFVDFQADATRIGRLGSETITLAYPWQDGQPYIVSLSESPSSSSSAPNRLRTVVLAAIIGLLVGVIVTFVWRGSPAGRAGRE